MNTYVPRPKPIYVGSREYRAAIKRLLRELPKHLAIMEQGGEVKQFDLHFNGESIHVAFRHSEATRAFRELLFETLGIPMTEGARAVC